MTRVGTAELKEPIPVLRYPVKADDTWTSEVTDANGERSTLTFTVGRQEKVKVKAGEYDAIPVTTEVQTKERAEKVAHWYAAGTGIVQVATGTGDAQVAMGLVALETEK